MQKLCIIAALGAGAIIAGLASEVYALPNPQPQGGNQDYTLSGDSLRGLESRETNKDASLFFPGTLSNSPRSRSTVLGEVTEKKPALNIPVEFSGGSTATSNSPSDAPLSQQHSGDHDEGMRVRYRLNN